MKNTNATKNQQTQNQTAQEVLQEQLENSASQVEEIKLNPYATNAMRAAIIRKSVEGRAKAIDAPYCEKCGVPKDSLQQWEYNVNSLYDAACDYSKALGTDDEEKTRQECWRIWKRIILAGEEDRFHPRMFVREKDVENFRVLAAESTQEYIPGVGFVPTVRGRLNFRGILEIRLALRIAGNATLNDNDRDTVTDYRKAVKVIKTTRELLEGKIDNQGNEIPSIYTLIETAEADLKELEDTLKSKGKKCDVDKLTKRQCAALLDLDNQRKAAEARLLKYLDVEKNLREDYNAIVARLDKLEGADAEAEAQKAAANSTALRDKIKAKLAEFDAKDDQPEHPEK